MLTRHRSWLGLTLTTLAMLSFAPAAHAAQDDGRSGADAGDTFEAATPLTPHGAYSGSLDRPGGDQHDYYKFSLPEGGFVSVHVAIGALNADPVTLMDPNGVVIDVGARARGTSASVAAAFMAAGAAFNGQGMHMRLAVHRAAVAGDYRLHLSAENYDVTSYSLCFMNCEPTRNAPIDLIFGGSLRDTRTKVLVIPPTHGDLGNPFGPTVIDYLEATLRGMRRWLEVADRFATDYPEYAYLRRITLDIEIFDGAHPVDPAGYDVILGYVAAGPAFRGIAGDFDQDDIEQFLHDEGLERTARFTGRVIALSLFGSSPRMGQVTYDFPEVTDLETVTMHEFGHTFGLGHTVTWHPELGPDLMNSPATFIYGDGFAAGDGGERTPLGCLSTLNMVGLATLYRWVPSGVWTRSGGSVALPPDMPYARYC